MTTSVAGHAEVFRPGIRISIGEHTISPEQHTISPEKHMVSREEMVSREVVVGMPQGLHARPADQLAREARKWQSRIELLNDSQRVDGKSILEVLTLAAEAGTRLVVEVTGPDAHEALEAIGTLFDRNFNEQENNEGR